MFHFLFACFIFLFTVLSSHATPSSPYRVTCKAKTLDTSTKTAIVQELLAIEETERMIIHRTKIADIAFEVQEWKSVFFFQPFIRFPSGQEITTSGYFNASGTIKLHSSTQLPNSESFKVDLRCCKDCSFSDWP